MIRKIDLLLLYSATLISVFFYGCFDTLKEPVLPNWDVDLNIPITQRTYKLSEIIKQEKNPNLGIIDSTGSDSLYVLLINNLHDTSPIVNSIKIPSILPENLIISGTDKGTSDLIFNRNSRLFRLDTAEFKSGSFHIKLLNNSSSTSLTYKLKAPGFKKADKSMLQLAGILTPGQIKDTVIDLRGYTYAQLKKYAFNTDSTQRGDGILFRGEAISSANNNVNFLAQVSNSDITLSRLVGKIVKIDLGFIEQEFFDVFGTETQGFSQKIKFKSTKVTVEAITKGYLRNLKVIVDSLSVAGNNMQPDGSYGATNYLRINNKQYYSDTLVALKTLKRYYDENNTNILDFLYRFPNLIKVKSKFIIDNVSQYSTGAISDKDSVKVNLNISAPVVISVAGAVFSDTANIDISGNDREEIIKSNSAKLTVEVENHIAIGLLAKCVLTDKFFNPLFSLRNSETTSNDVFEISPAAVDNNGIPSQPSITKLTCILNKEEFQKFKVAEYVIIDLKLHSTGSTSMEFGPFVQIRAKDFVKFKIYGGVNYRLDPEGNK